MVYLNKYKQISDEAEKSLYSLVKDLINKNTTNILEVGTYAGQVTVRLAAAAAEKNDSVRVLSIDDNNDTFSPSAEESLKVSNLFNCSFESDRMEERFEENIMKAKIKGPISFTNSIWQFPKMDSNIYLKKKQWNSNQKKSLKL